MPALVSHASHIRQAHASCPAVVLRSQSRRRRQRLILVSLTLGLARRRAASRSSRFRSSSRSLSNSHWSLSARRASGGSPFRLARFTSCTSKTAAAGTLRDGSPRRLRTAVRAVTHIGYVDGRRIHVFRGEVVGRIVSPRVDHGFQWDCVFKPDGHDQTFSEMGALKNQVSMRRKALEKLREHLAGADA